MPGSQIPTALTTRNVWICSKGVADIAGYRDGEDTAASYASPEFATNIHAGKRIGKLSHQALL